MCVAYVLCGMPSYGTSATVKLKWPCLLLVLGHAFYLYPGKPQVFNLVHSVKASLFYNITLGTGLLDIKSETVGVEPTSELFHRHPIDQRRSLICEWQVTQCTFPAASHLFFPKEELKLHRVTESNFASNSNSLL